MGALPYCGANKEALADANLRADTQRRTAEFLANHIDMITWRLPPFHPVVAEPIDRLIAAQVALGCADPICSAIKP